VTALPKAVNKDLRTSFSFQLFRGGLFQAMT